jgi:hypothetical protein
MPAIFPPRSSPLARTLAFAIIVTIGGIPLGLMAWVRTAQATGQYATVKQPIPFDHRVHVTGLGINCQFCHFSVERSANAGLPPTAACLPCHSQVWRSSPTFAPVRASMASGRPVAWKRVNAVPDFVFFNHAAHVAKHIDCASCHGDVGTMGQVRQVAPMTMNWCVSCHVDHKAPTNCTTCHR